MNSGPGVSYIHGFCTVALNGFDPRLFGHRQSLLGHLRHHLAHLRAHALSEAGSGGGPWEWAWAGRRRMNSGQDAHAGCVVARDAFLVGRFWWGDAFLVGIPGKKCERRKREGEKGERGRILPVSKSPKWVVKGTPPQFLTLATFRNGQNDDPKHGKKS